MDTKQGQGRPGKCTEELIVKAEEWISAGNSERSAARICGISYASWHSWREKPKTKEQKQFSDRIQYAIAVCESVAVKAITDAMESDPRQAEWFLEHSPQTRQTWADPARKERAISAAMSQVASILDKGLPDDLKARVFSKLAALDLYGDNAV